MTQKTELGKTELESLVTGFLAAAEFADCGADAEQDFPGISEAEWSEKAYQSAEKVIKAWYEKISHEDWEQAKDLAESHQDLNFDKLASIGTDIYYGAAGHGVGFWCRDEYTDGLGDRLHLPFKSLNVDSPYLGDDGLRYFD